MECVHRFYVFPLLSSLPYSLLMFFLTTQTRSPVVGGVERPGGGASSRRRGRHASTRRGDYRCQGKQIFRRWLKNLLTRGNQWGDRRPIGFQVPSKALVVSTTLCRGRGCIVCAQGEGGFLVFFSVLISRSTTQLCRFHWLAISAQRC